jgi:hypothetical protein
MSSCLIIYLSHSVKKPPNKPEPQQTPGNAQQDAAGSAKKKRNDRWLGKTVTLKKGPQTGLVGIVEGKVGSKYTVKAPGQDAVEAHPSFFKLTPPPEIVAQKERDRVVVSAPPPAPPSPPSPVPRPPPRSSPRLAAQTEAQRPLPPAPISVKSSYGAGYSKAKSILRQLEYYFSDENLAKDKFFSQKIADAEGGMVSMDFVHACPRLEKLRLSREELLGYSRNSTILRLSQDGLQIGRHDLFELAQQAQKFVTGS